QRLVDPRLQQPRGDHCSSVCSWIWPPVLPTTAFACSLIPSSVPHVSALSGTTPFSRMVVAEHSAVPGFRRRTTSPALTIFLSSIATAFLETIGDLRRL